MERLAPLACDCLSQSSLASAYGRPASRHSDRHLNDCPLDALRCILFEACTVCLSLWLIIEPRKGLSEPPQVYLWRQHQSNWGCCYTRLPHVAPGVENYRVALPSLRETARVAAVCRRVSCTCSCMFYKLCSCDIFGSRVVLASEKVKFRMLSSWNVFLSMFSQSAVSIFVQP